MEWLRTFMGKSAAIDVLEHFNSCVESIEKHKILQVFSDGPNVNLSFLKLLDEHRRDADLNPLINIDTCGLHTVHNSFKHGEKESDWNIKKLLNSIFKIFDESPSRQADYERINSASKSDFPLCFCSHRWVENDVVANRALSIWSKMIEVLDYWKGLPKSKQPGRGRPGENKSYDFLLSKMNDPFVPVKLRFFEEAAKSLNNFLVTFQTSSPMVPFLVDSLESLVCSFAERFILLDVLKQANTTLKLSQLDLIDPNIQMRTYAGGFSIDHDLRKLKREGKITDSHVNTFKKDAKQFVSTLCTDILSKSPLISYFAPAARCLNPINLAEIPDTCEKRFHSLLQKLVDARLITSLFADEAKSEFHKFINDVVRENKALFRNYDIKSFNLDGFFMDYLKDSIHYKSFTHVLKIILTLFHGQADVEHGFSLNKQLVVENMSETSLVAQRFVKDHMLVNNYQLHDMSIDKELIRCVKSSNSAYKEVLKQKRETAKKAEKDERLASIEEEITQLNLKKTSLEEAIKEYRAGTDKYAYDVEKKENLELLKLFNGLKKAAEKKQNELVAVLEKKKCLDEKKKI